MIGQDITNSSEKVAASKLLDNADNDNRNAPKMGGWGVLQKLLSHGMWRFLFGYPILSQNPIYVFSCVF